MAAGALDMRYYVTIRLLNISLACRAVKRVHGDLTGRPLIRAARHAALAPASEAAYFVPAGQGVRVNIALTGIDHELVL